MIYQKPRKQPMKEDMRSIDEDEDLVQRIPPRKLEDKYEEDNGKHLEPKTKAKKGGPINGELENLGENIRTIGEELSKLESSLEDILLPKVVDDSDCMKDGKISEMVPACNLVNRLSDLNKRLSDIHLFIVRTRERVEL